MIQANELRIKNIVQDGNGFEMRVVSIHDDGTVYCDFDGNEGDVWEFDDKNPCYGVELTEEILLEWGFKSDGLFCEFRRDDYVFKSDFRYIWIYDVELKNCICVKCEYLHRLQNLLFTLKGEELTKK